MKGHIRGGLYTWEGGRAYTGGHTHGEKCMRGGHTHEGAHTRRDIHKGGRGGDIHKEETHTWRDIPTVGGHIEKW